MKEEEILTDRQINDAWGNADFGQVDKRKIIGNALLKYATGRKTGRTIESICLELGLITKRCALSVKGKIYLFAHFSQGLSV